MEIILIKSITIDIFYCILILFVETFYELKRNLLNRA